MEKIILNVAVPVPLRQGFDFLCPSCQQHPVKGARVLIPFGSRKLIGVILEVKNHSDYPLNKLKSAIKVLDAESLFDDALWDTLLWMSRYYLAPIGEVFEAALPTFLRQGNINAPKTINSWALTDFARSADLQDLHRAPLQLAIVRRLQQQPLLTAEDFKDDSSGWRNAVKSLVQKKWLKEYKSVPSLLQKSSAPTSESTTLTSEQKNCVQALEEAIEQAKYSCSLMHGVTGSGKTRVYFEAMSKVLQQDRQVLLLVPEIGLTPQLVQRVERTFQVPITVLHSGLNDTERHLAWWHAREGSAKIVVGTRSAVFCSMPKLGMIIVDEEHDLSFKQQDGVRYHARNVAVVRAREQGIPIVLASATPALESFYNAKEGRYRYLSMSKRATKVEMPKVELIDLNLQPAHDGLSPALNAAIKSTLEQGLQAMVFLNRRGYAPVMYCKACKQSSQCHRCDSNLTYHHKNQKMRCHHCGYESRVQLQCRSCGAEEMVEVGQGTQRVEEALARMFPSASITRIDRDSTRRKGELQNQLRRISDGEIDIAIGTQLITKGHDFPKLGLVGILDADAGLFSTDYRAPEYLFQQLLQVAGRAGRDQQQGKVLIQTAFAEHTLFDFAKAHDYVGFSETLIRERMESGLPPFSYLVVVRAESTHKSKALQFLRKTKKAFSNLEYVEVLDPVPAPMERRAGRYRAQLLIRSEARSQLNGSVQDWLNNIAQDPAMKTLAGGVRWSVDVDPVDLY